MTLSTSGTSVATSISYGAFFGCSSYLGTSKGQQRYTPGPLKWFCAPSHSFKGLGIIHMPQCYTSTQTAMNQKYQPPKQPNGHTSGLRTIPPNPLNSSCTSYQHNFKSILLSCRRSLKMVIKFIAL